MKNTNQTIKSLLFFLFIFFVSQSCSTINLVSKYDCNTVANNNVNSKTTWTFAWGLVQPKDIDPHCEKSFNHLNKVTVKTNLGFILLSAVTVGIVIPQRLEWCCAPQEIKTDTLGTGKAPALVNVKSQNAKH
jgi:hypothetical protein